MRLQSFRLRSTLNSSVLNPSFSAILQHEVSSFWMMYSVGPACVGVGVMVGVSVTVGVVVGVLVGGTGVAVRVLVGAAVLVAAAAVWVFCWSITLCAGPQAANWSRIAAKTSRVINWAIPSVFLLEVGFLNG